MLRSLLLIAFATCLIGGEALTLAEAAAQTPRSQLDAVWISLDAGWMGLPDAADPLSTAYAPAVKVISLDSNNTLELKRSAKEIGKGIGFYVAIVLQLGRIADRFPQRRAECLAITGSLMDSYGPCLGQIKASFDQMGLGTVFGNIHASCQSLLDNPKSGVLDVPNANLADIDHYLAEVRAFSEGRVRHVMVEPLIRFHPGCIRDPGAGLTSPYRQTIRTDGSGKNLGIHFLFSAPGGWTQAEGDRPHIVTKFVSPRDSAYLVVQVIDLRGQPDAPTNDADAVRLVSSQSFVADIGAGLGTVEGSRVIDIARTKGQRIQWNKRVQKAAMTFDMRGISYVFVRDGRLITLGGSLGSGTGAVDPAIMAANAVLFDMIASTFDITAIDP